MIDGDLPKGFFYATHIGHAPHHCGQRLQHELGFTKQWHKDNIVPDDLQATMKNFQSQSDEMWKQFGAARAQCRIHVIPDAEFAKYTKRVLKEPWHSGYRVPEELIYPQRAAPILTSEEYNRHAFTHHKHCANVARRAKDQLDLEARFPGTINRCLVYGISLMHQNA